MEPDTLPTKTDLRGFSPNRFNKRRQKVGVVFTVLINFPGAIEAIHSLKSNLDLQIIIVDQWRWNRPLAKAWNDGAKQAFDAGCDYALVCNDDILLAPYAIDAMVEQYERLRHTEDVILVTPNNIMLELADPYDILTYDAHRTLEARAAATFSEHPNFSCFLIAPEFFDIHGTFDENFVPAWYEDNDSHRRATLLGYKEICTTAAPQVHIGGVATSMLPIEARDSSHSRDYYIQKWGGIPHPSNEIWTVPYGDMTLTPKDWIQQ